MIAYAENGRYPSIGNDKSKRSESTANACAGDAKPDADSSKSRKFESKSEEKTSKRNRYRSRSKTKSKSPIEKTPKCSDEKNSSDSVASATWNNDSKCERKNRCETKQSKRLEWMDVQKKSIAANDIPTTTVDNDHPQPHEEFHTIPLNLNISKQKHHFKNRTREKSLEKPLQAKCQLEDVRDDQKFETKTNKSPEDVSKSAKSAKNTKRKNEPMNAAFYDEYEEFLLNDNGHVEKESVDGTDRSTKNSIHSTDAREDDAKVKVELQNIKLEPPPLTTVYDRVPKSENIVPSAAATLASEKCAIEPIEVLTKIKNEVTLQTPADVRINSQSNDKSPSTSIRAEEFANESASKIDKSSTESGEESIRKSREKLTVPKRKRSSSSSSSSTTSSDSSSSSSSSDDDSSSSSSSDSNSSSSDSETSSNSSSSGKRSRESVETSTARTAASKACPVTAFVEQETNMQEKNFEELATKALQSYGFNLDEELLTDTNELLLKVESFKQNLEKRKAKQKNAAKAYGSEQVPGQSTVTDDTAIGDPNRSSILLKLNKPSVAPVSAASIFDSEIEHGRDKQSGKSNSSGVGSAKEADTSDDSRRSSHRNRGAARNSRDDDERSRRRSTERHRKRSDDDRKKSSTHRSRKSSRHRSRSPHSSKYAAPRNRDRRSSSRGRKTSRERHDSIDRGSKRSRNRIERFDRNERKSSFTPPPRRRSTSRNRSLASAIESRRRSLSPGRPYKQNMSPPPSWHRYERRSPLMCSCSPNRCNCVHRNGDQLSRNAAAAARGPRTPPNTPPSESNALYDRYGDREDVRAYAEHRSPSDLNHFAGCDQNIHIRLSLPPPPSTSLYHQSPIIGPPSADGDYGSGYSHSPLYAPNHFPFHSAPIHPPPSNSGLNHPHAPVLGSGDGYYYQTIFPPSFMIPNIEQQHSIQSQRSFAPYVSQPAYGNSPINPMQIKRPPMRKPERKSTIVQKGNVLEIVPGAELQQDAASEANTDPVPKSEVPPLSDEQILQMERLKRKKERQQKRLSKEKRKEFVINEIKRLSQQFIVGADGKMIKAGELLKTSCFGKYVNGSPRPDTNANDSNDTATSPPPVQLYDYDVNAKVGKSIIVSADSSNRSVPVFNGRIRFYSNCDFLLMNVLFV